MLMGRITRALLGGKENITISNLKLTSRDWQMLHSIATLMNLRQDTVIITEGSTNNYIYKIKKVTNR